MGTPASNLKEERGETSSIYTRTWQGGLPFPEGDTIISLQGKMSQTQTCTPFQMGFPNSDGGMGHGLINPI